MKMTNWAFGIFCACAGMMVAVGVFPMALFFGIFAYISRND